MIFETGPKTFSLHKNGYILQTQKHLINFDESHKFLNKIECNFSAITNNNDIFYYSVNNKVFECKDLFSNEHKEIDITECSSIIEIHQSGSKYLYFSLIEDYICISNTMKVGKLLLHKSTPYKIYNGLFYYYKNAEIVEHNFDTNTERVIYKHQSSCPSSTKEHKENISTEHSHTKHSHTYNTDTSASTLLDTFTFDINDTLIAYTNHSRVYLYFLSTKIRKEFHFHNFNILKIVIFGNSIFSVCKEKIICYEIFSEEKKFVCALKNFKDFKINNKNFYVLENNEFTVFERSSNKIVNKVLFLDKRSVYKGRTGDVVDDRVEDVNNAVGDIFEGAKTEGCQKIETTNFSDFSSALIFQVKNALFFVDEKFEKILKIYNGKKNFYKSFVEKEKLLIFEKEKNFYCLKICKIQANFEVERSLKINKKYVKNIKNVLLNEKFLCFLTKKSLIIFDFNGKFETLVKNVSFIGKFGNEIFYIKNNKIFDDKKNEIVKNLKIKKFYVKNNKIYFVTKNGLEFFDMKNRKCVKKGAFDDFYIQNRIYLTQNRDYVKDIDKAIDVDKATDVNVATDVSKAIDSNKVIGESGVVDELMDKYIDDIEYSVISDGLKIITEGLFKDYDGNYIIKEYK